MKQVYQDPNKQVEELSEAEKALYSTPKDGAKLKKTFAGEKAKLKEMNGSEKAAYIWGYYKLHILAVICAIGAIVYIIHHIMTYTVPVLYINVVNSSQVNVEREIPIGEYVGLEKHQEIQIYPNVDADADLSVGVMYSQFDLNIAADQMDIMFTDETGAKKACDYALIYEVKDMLQPELLELWADRIVSMDVLDESDETTYYSADVAVDISGTKVAEYFGLSDETKYLMIPCLSGNEDKLVKLFEMFYDIETGVIAVD